jgi:fumarate reductase subunit D
VNGIILLVLIGALVAFGWTRLRGKMKLPISGKSWVGPIFIVALVVLMLFSKSKGH